MLQVRERSSLLLIGALVGTLNTIIFKTMKPERKLRYLSEYMDLWVDGYGNNGKLKPFDRWLESTIDKKKHIGEVKAVQDHKKHCRYCGRQFDVYVDKTKDHVVPISKGGFDRKENRVYACYDCNQWKSDKRLKEWLKEVKAVLKKGKIKEPYSVPLVGRIIGNIIQVIDSIKFSGKKVSDYKI